MYIQFFKLLYQSIFRRIVYICVYLSPVNETDYELAGDMFRIALGNTQILLVNRYDVLKEITTCTSLDFGKPSYLVKDRGAILGNGIITSNGHYWAHQRKIIAPQLYMDKVKACMLNCFVFSEICIDPCSKKLLYPFPGNVWLDK